MSLCPLPAPPRSLVPRQRVCGSLVILAPGLRGHLAGRHSGKVGFWGSHRARRAFRPGSGRWWVLRELTVSCSRRSLRKESGARGRLSRAQCPDTRRLGGERPRGERSVFAAPAFLRPHPSSGADEPAERRPCSPEPPRKWLPSPRRTREARLLLPVPVRMRQLAGPLARVALTSRHWGYLMPPKPEGAHLQLQVGLVCFTSRQMPHCVGASPGGPPGRTLAEAVELASPAAASEISPALVGPPVLCFEAAGGAGGARLAASSCGFRAGVEDGFRRQRGVQGSRGAGKEVWGGFVGAEASRAGRGARGEAGV